MNNTLHSPTALGAIVVIAAAAIGFLVSIYDYFLAPGIDHSPGVLLVIASTGLILAASVVSAAYGGLPRWLRLTLDGLILLGLLGTAAAAYFLEAHVLLALMALGVIGWLVAALMSSTGHPSARQSYSGATP